MENEKYFIYFKFSDILLNFTVEINYINYIFINKNENIILSPGIKRIFLGYDSKNYIKLDLCQNLNISINYVKNEEIEFEKKNITYFSNEIIFIENENNGEDYYSLDIYSNLEMLISFSNKEFIQKLYQNYEININIVNIEKKIISVSFSQFSFYSEVEYIIYLFESEYEIDLKNLCHIQYLINEKLYLNKHLKLSNWKELYFEEILILENIIEKGKEYQIFVVANQISNYNSEYKYFSPKKFYFYNDESDENEENESEENESDENEEKESDENGFDENEENESDENVENKSYIWVIIIISILIGIGILLLFSYISKRKKEKNKIKLIKEVNEIEKEKLVKIWNDG